MTWYELLLFVHIAASISRHQAVGQPGEATA
jgi:hypothetical protein